MAGSTDRVTLRKHKPYRIKRLVFLASHDPRPRYARPPACAFLVFP